MAWGIFPHLPGAYLNSEICVVYSIISFVLTAFIAAYHLSTMFRRRKRKTDRLNVKPGTPAA
jgi:membrane protein implicated in regulation of membrane protease activity